MFFHSRSRHVNLASIYKGKKWFSFFRKRKKSQQRKRAIKFIKFIVVSFIVFSLIVIIYILIQVISFRSSYEKFSLGKKYLNTALYNYDRKDYTGVINNARPAANYFKLASDELSKSQKHFLFTNINSISDYLNNYQILFESLSLAGNSLSRSAQLKLDLNQFLVQSGRADLSRSGLNYWHY